jgi:hypothetical protein
MNGSTSRFVAKYRKILGKSLRIKSVLRLMAMLFFGLGAVYELGGVQGCLIPPHGDLLEQPPTRPFLNAESASPPLYEIKVVSGVKPAPLVFSIGVQSEDDGSPLRAFLVANYSTNPVVVGATTIDAGTFNNPRTISIEWRNPPATEKGVLAPGCYPFTLVVSHRFQLAEIVPGQFSDSDTVVWWVVVDDPNNPDFLTHATITSLCPVSEGRSETDGGSN